MLKITEYRFIGFAGIRSHLLDSGAVEKERAVTVFLLSYVVVFFLVYTIVVLVCGLFQDYFMLLSKMSVPGHGLTTTESLPQHTVVFQSLIYFDLSHQCYFGVMLQWHP